MFTNTYTAIVIIFTLTGTNTILRTMGIPSMKSHPLGQQAAVIGEVTSDHRGFIMMKTRVGGTRVVDMLSGEQLPRIC
jgi:hydrogenase expression/formation protein HypE